jgi:hypothetical protein
MRSYKLIRGRVDLIILGPLSARSPKLVTPRIDHPLPEVPVYKQETRSLVFSDQWV